MAWVDPNTLGKVVLDNFERSGFRDIREMFSVLPALGAAAAVLLRTPDRQGGLQ